MITVQKKNLQNRGTLFMQSVCLLYICQYCFMLRVLNLEIMTSVAEGLMQEMRAMEGGKVRSWNRDVIQDPSDGQWRRHGR